MRTLLKCELFVQGSLVSKKIRTTMQQHYHQQSNRNRLLKNGENFRKTFDNPQRNKQTLNSNFQNVYNHKNNHAIKAETQRPCSSQNQSSLQWETEGAPLNSVFKDMKWILTSDAHLCDKMVSFLLNEMDGRQFIGLDIEWDPVFRKGQNSRTALVQLGIYKGYCLIVKVCQMKTLPPGLQKVLTDPSILKIGVGIRDDVQKILRDFNVRIRGCVDLRDIAPRAEKQSLAALAQDHLGATMIKSKKLQMSKWSRHLSVAQKAYAAKDAYVAALLLPKLVSLKKQMPLNAVSQQDILSVVKAVSERKNGQTTGGKNN